MKTSVFAVFRSGFSGWRASVLLLFSQSVLTASFVNFETAPIHPVDISSDGRSLAVCNLPDGRVELLDVFAGVRSLNPVPVGVDPVSVRFRTTNELWVVNHISSSVNIVDVKNGRVIATLQTRSGPADVVFAGSPQRAFVSCAKEDCVQVFEPVQRQLITTLAIAGDRPKAMAVSPDGSRVYVAILESGNASTILAGGGVIADPSGPYGGQNPAPNEGANLDPPLYIDPVALAMGFPYQSYQEQLPDSIIVKRNPAGRWVDGNNGDWTEFISGTNATKYGRQPGWNMPDRDLAIIDAATFDISYATGLMNICMATAVNPASGKVAVVGTDGTNERRFEPKLRGIFLRVNLALVDPISLEKTIVDLNPHLDYSTYTVPPSVRDLSLGDPRGIVWSADGTRAYVTGMGSHNLIVIDAQGHRAVAHPIELGEGPTGMALDEAHDRLFILNRFSATLSVVDTVSLTITTNVSFFDPTPLAIKKGRKHLYDTRRNSGLGQLACGSCHVDARFDRLGWDLSNPAASTMGDGFTIYFHPIKGPLVTQTLQDIFAKVNFGLHWRADRPRLQDFNPTFTDLLGAERLLTDEEMQEFQDFLATIYFPPNRFRNLDNSFPTNLPLPGFFGFSPEGQMDYTPLPNGNGLRGRDIFISACTTCHTFPAGLGTGGDETLVTRGEGNRLFKPAQLRDIAGKIGMDRIGTSSRAGFGFGFNGSADTLPRFFSSRSLLDGADNQRLADLTAFLLAFTGDGSQETFHTSQDVPAGVGRQLTLTSPGSHPLLNQMLALADSPANRVDLIAHGVNDGLNRGWLYDRATGQFQSARHGEQISLSGLLALATPESVVTFTLVPLGSGRRLGVDHDDDGYFDLTEIESGFDPLDPLSHGANTPPHLAADPPIPPQVVQFHPGMSITHTFSAADSDTPTQALRLSLTRDIPAGSTFDPDTGVFTWTPAVEQDDRIWHIGVRAIDDGDPPLSDTTVLNIRVIVPRIKDIVLTTETNTGIGALLLRTAMRMDAVTNVFYELQSKDRLDDPTWEGHAIWVGIEPEILMLDDQFLPAQRQRFYRVRVLQSLPPP